VPPRKPSPVGSHILLTGTPSGLAFAERVGAEAIQIFGSNPRGWAQPRPNPAADAAFGERCAAAKVPLFLHAPYLVNCASPNDVTRTKSAAAIGHALGRGAALGAKGVVVHAGAAVDAGRRRLGVATMRELLLPILDGLRDDDPDLLIEHAAGGGEPIAATVEDLGEVMIALDGHPKLGVCLDTCHAYAAGHDIAAPGGIRAMLNTLVKVVGRGRLKLVHANDSKDPLGSRRDRHARIGHGTIGEDPFAELFRHPSTRGVPVIIETPGSVEDHADDIALLKSLRDR